MPVKACKELFSAVLWSLQADAAALRRDMPGGVGFCSLPTAQAEPFSHNDSLPDVCCGEAEPLANRLCGPMQANAGCDRALISAGVQPKSRGQIFEAQCEGRI